MSFERIKNRFMRLSVFNKLIAIASFFTLISVLLPWYEDLDQFRTGDMFLGITGPLYLAGYVILLSSAVSFGLILLKILDKKAPKLPMTESHMHIGAAVMNLFLLVMVNSVYFHSKFGVNIALKESKFGMLMAFAGTILLLVVSILMERSEKPDFNLDSGKLEPLIEMREQRKVEEIEESRGNSMHQETPIKEEKVAVSSGGDELHEQVKKDVDRPAVKRMSSKPKENSNRQPWRMDL